MLQPSQSAINEPRDKSEPDAQLDVAGDALTTLQEQLKSLSDQNWASEKEKSKLRRELEQVRGQLESENWVLRRDLEKAAAALRTVEAAGVAAEVRLGLFKHNLAVQGQSSRILGVLSVVFGAWRQGSRNHAADARRFACQTSARTKRHAAEIIWRLRGKTLLLTQFYSLWRLACYRQMREINTIVFARASAERSRSKEANSKAEIQPVQALAANSSRDSLGAGRTVRWQHDEIEDSAVSAIRCSTIRQQVALHYQRAQSDPEQRMEHEFKYAREVEEFRDHLRRAKIAQAAAALPLHNAEKGQAKLREKLRQVVDQLWKLYGPCATLRLVLASWRRECERCDAARLHKSLIRAQVVHIGEMLLSRIPTNSLMRCFAVWGRVMAITRATQLEKDLTDLHTQTQAREMAHDVVVEQLKKEVRSWAREQRYSTSGLEDNKTIAQLKSVLAARENSSAALAEMQLKLALRDQQHSMVLSELQHKLAVAEHGQSVRLAR